MTQGKLKSICKYIAARWWLRLAAASLIVASFVGMIALIAVSPLAGALFTGVLIGFLVFGLSEIIKYFCE